MFLRFPQTLGLVILAYLSAHTAIYAMDTGTSPLRVLRGLWKIQPNQIWVGQSLSAKPKKMSVDTFSCDKKHRKKFAWLDGLLAYEPAPKYLFDPDSFDEKYAQAILDNIHGNEDKLVIRYINEQVGWGVFAREDIIPDRELGHTYLAYYAGALDQGSTMQVTHKESKYILGVIGENGPELIDAGLYRNIAGFIQHAPKSLDDYTFAPKLVHSTVATSNISYRILRLRGAPFIVFYSEQVIPKDTQLLHDYGNTFWKNTEEYPQLFSKKNEIIDPSLYKANKVNMTAELDPAAKALLHPATVTYTLEPLDIEEFKKSGLDYYYFSLAGDLIKDDDVMLFIHSADIFGAYDKNPHNANLYVTAHLTRPAKSLDKSDVEELKGKIMKYHIRCDTCGLKPEKLLLCSRCKNTAYCNQICQRKDWTKHKTKCKANP